MAKDMQYPSNDVILKTFLWYFSVILGEKNQDQRKNKEYSIALGKMIASLPMRYVCGLDNGEINNFHPTAEFELVGRGLLYPLYRLDHSNDHCYDYLSVLHNQIKSGYLERLYVANIDPENLKALAPYILLLINKHKELLKNKAYIDFSIEQKTLRNLNNDDVVRNLTSSQNKDIYRETLSPTAKVLQKQLIIACSENPDEVFRQRPQETLIQCLNVYIEKRKLIQREYYFPFFSKLFGGFSRTEKLAAAESLKESIQNPTRFFKPEHAAALQQGQLKNVIDEWQKRSGENLSTYVKGIS